MIKRLLHWLRTAVAPRTSQEELFQQGYTFAAHRRAAGDTLWQVLDKLPYGWSSYSDGVLAALEKDARGGAL